MHGRTTIKKKVYVLINIENELPVISSRVWVYFKSSLVIDLMILKF
jgi:hypothetical protein